MKLAITAVLAGSLLLGCRDEGLALAAHVHGPHDGLIAGFQGGDTIGYLELKLHDDKGDLELWLGHDRKLELPFHLSLDANPEVEFLDRDHRKIKLGVRDRVKNEGEDGTPHVTDNKTDYFIFPGATGADASWLKGVEFQSRVVVRFREAGVDYESMPMNLAPHTH